MTSRALLALALAVVPASGVGSAALLDQQATTPAPPVGQTPAVLDLDAVLADVETAVAQSVDANAIAKQVQQAMQGAKVAALIGGSPRLGIAGTWVTSAEPESAAARAGLAEGDIIVRVDGQAVRSARHLTRLVSETPAAVRPLRGRTAAEQ